MRSSRGKTTCIHDTPTEYHCVLCSVKPITCEIREPLMSDNSEVTRNAKLVADAIAKQRQNEQRRFELAKAVAGGISANANPYCVQGPDEIARIAVAVADAVLKALEAKDEN